MCKQKLISNKFDLNQTTRVLHNNDIQHNDTQYNDIQHNDTQYNDIQHNVTQHNDDIQSLLQVFLC